jgi:hypothetical protein
MTILNHLGQEVEVTVIIRPRDGKNPSPGSGGGMI